MKSGIVIINKERGMTSQQVVSKVKRILNVKKAGHIGTLDPLASGILPVLIGNATKLSKYLIEHDKTYLATIKLGQKRDTGDEEGKVIKEAEVPDLEEDKIIKCLENFKGKQEQTPPVYSAIKVNGKKLYEYAREGVTVDIPKREIEIYQIKLNAYYSQRAEISFSVACSKGTYIRTLCEDISEKLGTVGFMKALVRTSVENVGLDNAVKLENLSDDDILSMENLCQRNV